MTAEDALGLVCRRQRAVGSADPPEEIIAHALCPPPEVLVGQTGRARRLLPGRDTGRRWWDVEFFPLRREGGLFAVLGRITLSVGVEGGLLLLLLERVSHRWLTAMATLLASGSRLCHVSRRPTRYGQCCGDGAGPVGRRRAWASRLGLAVHRRV